jgi:PAS domain S-box-containing protein
VEELGVVAYAGIPLTTPEGEAIGAFCAIDSQPRKWSEHELEVLEGLAQAVMTEIALRLKTKELERSSERMASVLENISNAFFHLDKNWCFTYINDQATQLLGREREELLGRNAWEEFPQAVGTKFDIKYRHAISSGLHVTFEDYFEPLQIWFEIHAYPGQDGLSVYFHDITQRKRDEERLRLLESAVVNANDAITIPY